LPPGKGWNTIFRINGALEPWFDKTWKPGEIVQVNRALASLYEEMRHLFPLPAKICQIESDKIAVAALIDDKVKYFELVKKVINDASNMRRFTVSGLNIRYLKIKLL
jgi:hypothetical protein